jgi:FtsH-binding integral membrane protein
VSKPANDDAPIGRLDRVLAFMSLGLLSLSILCFIAIFIGSATGADFSSGVWPAVGVTVYIAPILAFGFMLAVLVRSFIRRARANKGR